MVSAAVLGKSHFIFGRLPQKLTLMLRYGSWNYTFTLCLVRVVGAVCQLLMLTNDSTKLLEAVLILQHIGLAPLLLSTLGMLSRLCVFSAPSLIYIRPANLWS